MMKRLISLILCIVMICSCSICYAQSGLTLEKVHASLPEKYVLPAYTYNGQAIEVVGSESFENQTELRILTVPSSVHTIQRNAFSGCYRLTVVLIPETVTTIEKNAFSGVNALCCIVTPTGSTAAAYARSNSLRCIELENRYIDECDEAYVSMAMYAGDVYDGGFIAKEISSKEGYTRPAGNEEYLTTLGKWDSIMLGVNNMDSTFYKVLDWIMPNDGNLYMGERYSKELGEVLSMMSDIDTIQLSIDSLSDPIDYFQDGVDLYNRLVKWLHDGLDIDHPFVEVITGMGLQLSDAIDNVDDFINAANFILYCLEDYSECLEMLSILRGIANESTDTTFTYAINLLEKEYNTAIEGMLYKGIQEMLLPMLRGVAEKGIIEAGVQQGIAGYSILGYYLLAQKAIDLGLAVTGSAELRDKQLAYIALLEVSHTAELMYRREFNDCDGSVESLRRLQMLWEFCRCISIRLYEKQYSLFSDSEHKARMAYSKQIYELSKNKIYNYYSANDLNQIAESDSLLTEKTGGDVSDAIISVGSLSSYWRTKHGKYIDDMTEYGYGYTDNRVSAYLDRIPLGEMGAWYVDYGGAVNASDMIDLIVEEDMSENGSLAAFWHGAGSLSDIRLSRSELLKQERLIWEDYGDGYEIYVSEIWTEFYLFSGTITEHNQPRSFELLIMLAGSSEGTNWNDSIVSIR